MTTDERVKEHLIKEKAEIDALARMDEAVVASILNSDHSKAMDVDEGMAILEKRLVDKGTI